MLRKVGFAAVTAALGLALAAGPAAAITRTTLQCIKGKRLAFKDCQSACRDDLQTGIADCYGPGAGCATACQTTLNGCVGPFNDQLKACNDGCNAARQTATNDCKDQFGAPGQEAQLEACANQARATNLQCRLGCRDQVDDPISSCTIDYNDCVQACASQPNP